MCSTRPSRCSDGERAHAGGERRPRVGRVELVEVDALDAEGAPARLAGGGQVARAAVRHPAAARAGSSPPLVATRTARRVAAPGRERARDQPLVVAGVARVQAVGVGGVEQGDAGVEGRVQRRERAGVVAVRLGREPHAADGQRLTEARQSADTDLILRKKRDWRVDRRRLRSSYG